MNTENIEKVFLINGNGQECIFLLPKIKLLGDWNDVALKHIAENAGLIFSRENDYIAQPIAASQITRLLMTYNFETQYFNNFDHTNILYLKYRGQTHFIDSNKEAL